MCVLCDQEQETTQHLAGGCVFAREVWYRVLAPIGLDHLAPQPRTSFLDQWLLSHLQLGTARRKCFDSLIILDRGVYRRSGTIGFLIASVGRPSRSLSLWWTKRIGGLKRGSATSPRFGRPQAAVDLRQPILS